MSPLSVRQRHDHLALMGVTQWYARAHIKGALSTPDYIEQAASDFATGISVSGGEVVSEKSQVGQVDSKNLLTSLKTKVSPATHGSAVSNLSQNDPSQLDQQRADQNNLSGDVDLELNATQEVRPVTESPALIVESNAQQLATEIDLSSVQSFALNAFVSPGVVILSELTNSAPAHQELALAKNILKSIPALSAKSDSLAFDQSFSWPVFKSLNLQATQHEMLKDVFSRWVDDVTAQAELIVYLGQNVPGLSSVVRSSAGSIKTLVLPHSLKDMIQIPFHKKAVWDLIKQEFF